MLGTLLQSHRHPAWAENLPCSIPPHLNSRQQHHLQQTTSTPKPQPSSSSVHLLQLLISPGRVWRSLEQRKEGAHPRQPHLGSAGRSGRRGGHGGTAVVALAGAGAGACWGGCSGGGFGPSASRPEWSHPLGGSLWQDEFLSELKVGSSSCCKGPEQRAAEGCRNPTSSPGLRRLWVGGSQDTPLPCHPLRAARPWVSQTCSGTTRVRAGKCSSRVRRPQVYKGQELLYLCRDHSSPGTRPGPSTLRRHEP